jgi:hypothetical protein
VASSSKMRGKPYTLYQVWHLRSWQEGYRTPDSSPFESGIRGFLPSTRYQHDHPHGKEAPSGEDLNLLHPDTADCPKGLPPLERDYVNLALHHAGSLGKTVPVQGLWALT